MAGAIPKARAGDGPSPGCSAITAGHWSCCTALIVSALFPGARSRPGRLPATGPSVSDWRRSSGDAAMALRRSDCWPAGAVRAHRQAAVRAPRYLGLLLEPGDDVDGVAAHDGRIRPVEGSFQCGRDHCCRQAPHPGDPWVTHLGLFGARGQHPRERPIRIGPEDHPLLLAIQGEAVAEELGALLAQ
jgi:hypothetical protein